MANMQGPVVPPTPEQEVACAISCCDKKPYPLVKRKGDKECQRLGSKKHSCVLHKLRKKTPSGKLTQDSSVPGVEASPRYNVPGISRTLIPDTRIGNRVIDAKFPCDPAKTKNTPPIIAQPASPGTGASMLGKKEKEDYLEIPGVKSVEGMSPQDADTKKHAGCVC